jgi:serine/threonine protein phosphatase 1
MFLGDARTPPGMRLYAIGDVHGCDDLLAEVHAGIEADLRRRPAQSHRIVHVGDYVDRGPKSAEVVARLLRLTESDASVVCLSGNHEDALVRFLDDPEDWAPTFLGYGGVATLQSYGVDAEEAYGTGGLMQLRDAFAAAMPAAHQAFIRGLPLSARFGDYLFCHAGIRPGVALERQTPDDLRWIRQEFLESSRDHGFVVVHGHTPAERPEVRRNRINVDTGAVFTGRLTCAVLEGTEYRFL